MKKEIKVGDTVLVEQAWEDETGNYHDEYAEVLSVKEGLAELKFFEANEEVQKFLGYMQWSIEQLEFSN